MFGSTSLYDTCPWTDILCSVSLEQLEDTFKNDVNTYTSKEIYQIQRHVYCSVISNYKTPNCCWDDRLMAPNQSSWRSKLSNEIRCPMASMDLSLTDVTPLAIFTLKVIQGHFCGFWKSVIDFPIVFHNNEMPVWHRQEDIGDFHICDLERSTCKIKGHCGFWNSVVKFPLVFHSNHRSISPLLSTIH